METTHILLTDSDTFQIEVVAGYGDHKEGYAAVDNIILNSMPEDCKLTPDFADPTVQTTTSTTFVTEPPGMERAKRLVSIIIDF